jgi:hypothetical protein
VSRLRLASALAAESRSFEGKIISAQGGEMAFEIVLSTSGSKLWVDEPICRDGYGRVKPRRSVLATFGSFSDEATGRRAR